MVRRLLVIGFLATSFLMPRPRRRLPSTRSCAGEVRCHRTVILALIDRDRTVFAIEPEQIVALQREVSARG